MPEPTSPASSPASPAPATPARVLVRDGFIDDDGIASVPLGAFLESAAGVRVLRLAPGDDVRALAGKLAHVTRIELVLPKFGEGRPYTQARVLREELGYLGEIRAIGEVRRDLLFFLFRCGVTQAILKNPEEERDAHQSLSTFSVLYQGAADVAQPLWRRAVRGEGTRT